MSSTPRPRNAPHASSHAAETASGNEEVWAFAMAGLDDQSTMRSALVEHLYRLGIARSTTADVTLVVTELATNAFTHGRATTIDITICQRSQSLTIAVSQPHSDSAPLELGRTMPGHESPRGRGLAIVEALTDHLTETRDDAEVCIEATIALAPNTELESP